MTKNVDEVAKWFEAINATGGANFGTEVYPGYPGLVVAEGELQCMVWGFPLVLKSKRTGEPLKPKPVNNARSDKLDSYMWRHSFAERRCLIPLTAWAEAEGPKGAKTRTWLSLLDAELFAVAGIWRDSDERGRCYSMVMTDSSEQVSRVHSRMPVILERKDSHQWLFGTALDAKSLCLPYVSRVAVEKTDSSWIKSRSLL